MEFDPFVGGPLPVGVRSGQLVDSHRGDRRLAFEVWYPAAPRYSVQDPSPVTQDTFAVLPNTPPLDRPPCVMQRFNPGAICSLSTRTRASDTGASNRLCAPTSRVTASSLPRPTTPAPPSPTLVDRANAGTTLSPPER